jgi:acyl-CoA reductase-like NAD-dependent aldehyde dehydrogenase
LAVLQAQVDDAVAKGARVLCGGRRLASRPQGSFFEVRVVFGKRTRKKSLDRIFGSDF